MKKLLFWLLFLPGLAHAQTISVPYEMSLRPGKAAATLPPALVLQLDNIVIDFNYRFFQNKSEYVFVEQRAKNPNIPKLYSSREIGINIYKDFNTNLLYRNSKQLPGVVSKEFFPDPKWEIQADSNRNIIGYTCRKATATDGTGQLISAWYALDIAVPDGPSRYGGLRGLILELESEDFLIRATGVTIDPENKTEITIPQAVEYVTEEEFDALKKRH